MAGATDLFEDDLLDLIFTNVDCPNVGDAAGLQNSATAGSWYISLHTADPTDTATAQTASEATWGAYARQAVARSVAGWTVASGNCDNDSVIQFPECTSGSETMTHVGLGSAVSGAGNLQIIGTISPNLAVSTGVQPEFAAGDLDISLD